MAGTAGNRLRLAREAAGFATASEAAEAMSLPVSTYLGHENGSRGIPAKRAVLYARTFDVAAEWLLFAKRPEPSAARSLAASPGRGEVLDVWERIPEGSRPQALRVLRAFVD